MHPFQAQPGSRTLRVRSSELGRGDPAMAVHVGIDVHRKRTQVAVVTEDGQVQLNKNVVNGSPMGLRMQSTRHQQSYAGPGQVTYAVVSEIRSAGCWCAGSVRCSAVSPAGAGVAGGRGVVRPMALLLGGLPGVE